MNRKNFLVAIITTIIIVGIVCFATLTNNQLLFLENETGRLGLKEFIIVLSFLVIIIIIYIISAIISKKK